jgi:NAD(P)-dependent dehydrogenase (short-subunit alcohol dehydrogenase family)
MPKWTANEIPDLSGKTAVVTGANSGLGYWTAYWLACKGARVILASRSQEKARRAVDELHARQENLVVEIINLDLASLESVRNFGSVFRERYFHLDILVNNAGVMAIPFRQTIDGFEMQFGVNHLGHFALTGLLLEPLLATPGSRVVTVSSMVHLGARIDFKNLNAEKSYHKAAAYGQSKLANLLFAYELQRRLSTSGAQTISLGTNPGYAATNLQTVGPQMERNRRAEWIYTEGNRWVAQSAPKSALTSLFAATSPAARGGDYIQPRWFTIWGYPQRSKSSPASYDRENAARLWQISEELTGIKYLDD